MAAPQVELVSVAGARDIAHASLMLGEQRAWIEHVTGLDLAAVQPDERGNLLYWYRPPAGRLLLARLDGSRSGSSACAGSRTASRTCGASTCAPGRGAGGPGCATTLPGGGPRTPAGNATSEEGQVAF